VTAELMDAGASAGIEAGTFGPGDDPTVGDFDVTRLEAFIPALTEALGVDQVDLAGLVTNAFVDPTIGQ
jgi:hypothetical protein